MLVLLTLACLRPNRGDGEDLDALAERIQTLEDRADALESNQGDVGLEERVAALEELEERLAELEDDHEVSLDALADLEEQVAGLDTGVTEAWSTQDPGITGGSQNAPPFANCTLEFSPSHDGVAAIFGSLTNT